MDPTVVVDLIVVVAVIVIVDQEHVTNLQQIDQLDGDRYDANLLDKHSIKMRKKIKTGNLTATVSRWAFWSLSRSTISFPRLPTPRTIPQNNDIN